MSYGSMLIFLYGYCNEQVVIMLVIDKENDRALLSRQSRFMPRMLSCLAGFIELCESCDRSFHF